MISSFSAVSSVCTDVKSVLYSVKNKTSEKDDCYGDDYDMCKDCVIEFYKKKVRDKE